MDSSWTPAARERWADSPQWAEYTERSAARTAEDWRVIAPVMQSAAERLA
ncbi:TipAS antibiotic-recognition domain-containing protein [Arthrobacter sp. YN]